MKSLCLSTVILALGFLVGSAKADPILWQQVRVSTIHGTGGFGISFANLPDGRIVLGQQKKLFVQPTWGGAEADMVELTQTGDVFDPSFVAVRDSTNALLGAGGSFGAVSGLHPFDPSILLESNPAFGVQTAIANAQSYAAVWWESPTSTLAGWLIGGANGPSGPFSGHNIVFVSADGTKAGEVTEELCTYSAGITTDAAGNLYTALFELDGTATAADADKVLCFPAAFLEPKIRGIMDGAPEAPLARNAATFIYKFHSASSIAVDALGRVWASGWKVPQVQVFDPATGAVRALTPEHAAIDGGQDTYQVSAFAQGGTARIGMLAYDSFMFSDTPVFFVHAPVGDVTMPTVSTFATWRVAQFGPETLTLATEPTNWGELADPDGDGLANVVEYAFQTSPFAANTAPISANVEAGLLTISFLRDPLNSDLSYIVEVSSTLGANDWTAIASSTGGAPTAASGASTVQEVPVPEGSMVRVTVTDQNAAAGASQRFIRVRLTVTPP
ncbi:MAG: hypothetical protein ACOYMN_15065 [Roseimicrobium sp.]